MAPESIPGETLARKHSGTESLGSLRCELVSLTQAIQGEKMGEYKGLCDGIKHVQKIRKRTIEAVRKNADRLRGHYRPPSPQPVMVMTPGTPLSRKKSHDSITLEVLEGRVEMSRQGGFLGG